MAVLIRNAGAEDLAALESLEQQCFSVPWTRDMLQSQLPDGMHEFLVAEENGAVQGYVGMMFVLDEGYISNVAVTPAKRAQSMTPW